ncbi:MAG: hypothetical protein U9R58_11965 [Chloroflexota bacterium]|nr:hypothetical protein [Chloroflexota bacterium]
MPHATYAYPFEFVVWEFAGGLSRRKSSDERTFVLVLDQAGEVESLKFEHEEATWFNLKVKLEETGVPYLFYDPFDAPEFYWLSWHKIGRTTMERLIGKPFDDADFMEGMPGSNRPPDPDTAIEYPETWGVMF